MLHDLEPMARQLAEYMSELSEKAYAAGWMDELEFELWAALDEGPRDYGRLRISNDHIDKDDALSEVERRNEALNAATESQPAR